MNRALLALTVVLGTASTAAAEGIYFTEAVGGTDVKNELGSELSSAVRVRFSVGYRLNTRWAVEAYFAGDLGVSGGRQYSPGVAARCIDCGEGSGGGYYDYSYPASLASVGFDVKYLHPVSEHVEAYVRGGLSKAWLDKAGDYAGRGLGVGAGVQLKGKVPALGFLFWPLFFTNWGPKVTAALFLDAGADFYRLHRNGQLDNPDSIDASMNRITLGWAVGADF